MDTNTEDAKWDGETREKQILFVNIVEHYPILLAKSNLPEVKRKKTDAVAEIKGRLTGEFGIKMSEAQIWKKVNNMKTRIKRKTGRNEIGNRKIILKGWEEKFWRYMEGETNRSVDRIRDIYNVSQSVGPTVGGELEAKEMNKAHRNLSLGTLVGEVEKAVSTGVLKSEIEEEEVILQKHGSELEESESLTFGAGSLEGGTSDSSAPDTLGSSFLMSKSSKEHLNKHKCKQKLTETEETEGLSTHELQRLVLLEQLQVFRLAKEFLLKKKQE